MPILTFGGGAEEAFKKLGDPEAIHDLLRIHPEGRWRLDLSDGELVSAGHHPSYHAETSVDLKHKTVHNRNIIAESAPPGTGTKILARQVLAARKLGFPVIHIHHAAGEGPEDFFHGSYVWPRLGFNRDLPKEFWRHFPGHKDFHSIMKDPRLIEKWKALRKDLYDLEFHTAADSPHSQHLLEYMKSKGIKI